MPAAEITPAFVAKVMNRSWPPFPYKYKYKHHNAERQYHLFSISLPLVHQCMTAYSMSFKVLWPMILFTPCSTTTLLKVIMLSWMQ